MDEDLELMGWTYLPGYSYFFNLIEKARYIFEANI